MNPQHCKIRIMFLPVVQAIVKPLFPLVECMIGCVADDIKTGIGQFISHFIRRIECRIAGNTKLLSANDDFLIDQSQIGSCHFLLHICKNRSKIKRTVLCCCALFHSCM